MINKNHRRTIKLISIKLLVVFVFQLSAPTISFALTGGPSQPEVQGFTPIGTSEMVDVFTGDFNYNIPLLDVDGYPINLSYRSGASMEEEASWVGLGWSLNVGTVNRSMRGLPDDFNGDKVQKVLNMKPTRTIGLSGGTSGLEIFGFDVDQVSLSASVGINFNNYNGFGFEKSVSLSVNSSKTGNGPLNANLGLTSDTNEGLTVQPSLSLSISNSKTEKSMTTFGLSIGTAYNSRSGLKQLTITKSLTSGERGLNEKGEVDNQLKQSITSQLESSSSFNVGTPTFSPSSGPNMKNLSISGRFTAGGAFFGTNPNFFINAYYSSQGLEKTNFSNNAYGYLYSSGGQSDSKALMDFNREKDVPFVNTLEVLPITNFTYDIFSVSGQGTGGSYRAFRGDVGHVFDATSTSTTNGNAVGAEFGVGNVMHNGGSISVNSGNNTSGDWTQNNSASSNFSFKGRTSGDLFEDYYFMEANERGVTSDTDWLEMLGGYEARRFALKNNGNFDVDVENKLIGASGGSTVDDNKRKIREKRNQVMNVLSHNEVKAGYGIYAQNYASELTINSGAKDHHISQITTLGNDGSRYVYAQPLYNTKQKEVTFAIGTSLAGDGVTPDCSDDNLVTYTDNDASTGNSRGLDNYYSSTITPAFVHSYLLSALLSSDYVDSDGDPGPSTGDLGTYTLFKYTDGQNYNWRSPMAAADKRATFSDGVRVDETDDKASYIYGEKEIRYLHSIETKNYFLEFVLGDRDDARGVQNENGGLGAYSKCLKQIKLYSKGLNGSQVLIKTVHFDYNNSLCSGVPNNASTTEGNTGKLTLKSVHFTYENSNRGRFAPYTFEYANNKPYNRMAMDRWGNYKPQVPCTDNENPRNDDFPYCDQSSTTADSDAAAWHLSIITLPSGGKIGIDYEADDYAYVQDKPAMQMFKIIGTYNSGTGQANIANHETSPILGYPDLDVIEINQDLGLLFELPENHDYNESTFLQGINNEIYLRCMVNLKPTNDVSPSFQTQIGQFEPIPVYAYLNQSSFQIIDIDPTSGEHWVGSFKLGGVSLTDSPGSAYSPISKTALQYGRLQASRIVYDENGDMPDMSNASGLALAFLEELANFVIDKNIGELFQSSNETLYNRNLGKYLLPKKSFIRLSCPMGHKIGGGSRVKRIKISDEWESLASGSSVNSEYGQEYNYNLEDGRSSGVASYEPMLGADENPFRMPMEYEIKNVMAPDEARFIEKPVGESFYPSPSVGYSRVTVTDYLPSEVNVNRHGTGKIVQEFYTSKDFPTIVEKTNINTIRHKTDPFSIASLLNLKSRDYVTTTQGFAIETNDMHGKQKAQYVFKQGSNTPISSVKYFYQDELIDGKKRLNNRVKAINNEGEVEEAEIGVHFDMITDMRESVSESYGGGIQANNEKFVLPWLPTPIPLDVIIPIPSVVNEKTIFRSATATKVIQRFGILSRVVATDNTSVVETENLAYDSQTGEVLVTRTSNNFDDKVYTVTFPAHWYYDGMGPAYQNINFEGAFDFVAGTATILSGTGNTENANNYFSVGDELATPSDRAWVIEVTNSTFTAVFADGTGLAGIGIPIKVMRSGRRNLSSTPIATISLLSNPLDYFQSNVFEKVTQASAIEFSDDWGTFCDCFSKDKVNFTSNNPYAVGAKGTWRPTRNYTYLTDRIQAYYNKNTNVRRDGVFQSFSPFYFQQDGEWNMDKTNWTWASEVTQFSPFGNEIENRDALGRYSTAHFGYRHTLPIAVAANAAFANVGFNNFEDHNSSDCGRLFAFSGGEIIDTRSHTGRNSIKVTYESPASYGFSLWEDCDNDDDRLDLTASSTNTITIGKGSGTYVLNLDVYSGTATVSSVTSNLITLATSTSFIAKVQVEDSEGRRGEIIMEN